MIIQYDEFGGGRGLINLPNNSFWKIYVQESSEYEGKDYFDYNIVLSHGLEKVKLLYLNYLMDDLGIPWLEVSLFANSIIEEITKLIIANASMIDINNVFYDILEQGGYRAKWLEKGYISEGEL